MSITKLFLLGLILVPGVVRGEPAEQPPGGVVPCAILTGFDGDVQILDASRSHLVETDLKVGVPCGGWVSVQDGWAELKHRQGYVLRLGPKTFTEIFDNEEGTRQTGADHVVLYRGKIHVEVGSGLESFHLATANARVRVDWGKSVVQYFQTEEETQLVTIERTAKMENRFEDQTEVALQAGEASSLSFRAMRVQPSTPRAVKTADMRELLLDLPLKVEEISHAIQIAKKRGDRVFAADVHTTGNRKPASPKTYVRHRSEPGDALGEKKWTEKLVGGTPGADDLLFPGGRDPAQVKKVQLESRVKVIDVSRKLEANRAKDEDREKKRLMEELTRVRF